MLISCEGTRPFPAPSGFTGTAQISGNKGTDAEISLPILSCFPTECPRKNIINKGSGRDRWINIFGLVHQKILKVSCNMKRNHSYIQGENLWENLKPSNK